MATTTTSSVSDRARVGVGVGVLVTSPRHPGCILGGVRKNSTGSGQFALPGGHLEFGEEWTECAQRELLEETGLKMKDPRYVAVVNAVRRETGYHYITLFVQGEVDIEHRPEPENLEPHKCEGWEWRNWNEFPPPEQLFLPLEVLREQGYDPLHSDRK